MDNRGDPDLSTARKLYTILTLAYPSGHRKVFGLWMVQLFCDQYRAARATHQPGELALFWLRTLADLVVSALREQMAELRRSMMTGMESNSSDPHARRDRIARWLLLGLALIILATGSTYFFPQFFGYRTGPGMAIFLVLFFILGCLLFGSRFGASIKRWGAHIWIYAGLLILAALLAPAYILVRPQEAIPFPLSEEIFKAISLVFFFIPGIALVFAAALIQTGVAQVKERQAAAGDAPARVRPAGWMAVALFSLSALLIGKTIYNLYWLGIWDSTDDSLDYYWLITPVFFTVFAGVLLAALLPWKLKVAGFGYALLIPALMAGVYYSAKQVDYRQLTEARAAQVSQALEAYHSSTGSYPQSLAQLTPWYLFTVPGPVIMVGQNNWCYQGGVDYYRLGFLDSNHWSSPIRFGRLVSGQGHSPVKEDVCQEAIDTYRARFPNWDETLQDYGKPTPTPDVQEIMSVK